MFSVERWALNVERLPPKAAVHLPSVTADRFDRTTFHRFFTERFLFRRFRLFVNIGMAAVVVALEIGRCSLTTQVAVDALIIDIELPLNVLGILIRYVGHIFYGKSGVEC